MNLRQCLSKIGIWQRKIWIKIVTSWSWRTSPLFSSTWRLIISLSSVRCKARSPLQVGCSGYFAGLGLRYSTDRGRRCHRFCKPCKKKLNYNGRTNYTSDIKSITSFLIKNVWVLYIVIQGSNKFVVFPCHWFGLWNDFSYPTFGCHCWWQTTRTSVIRIVIRRCLFVLTLHLKGSIRLEQHPWFDWRGCR